MFVICLFIYVSVCLSMKLIKHNAVYCTELLQHVATFHNSYNHVQLLAGKAPLLTSHLLQLPRKIVMKDNGTKYNY